MCGGGEGRRNNGTEPLIGKETIPPHPPSVKNKIEQFNDVNELSETIFTQAKLTNV